MLISMKFLILVLRGEDAIAFVLFCIIECVLSVRFEDVAQAFLLLLMIDLWILTDFALNFSFATYQTWWASYLIYLDLTFFKTALGYLCHRAIVKIKGDNYIEHLVYSN